MNMETKPVGKTLLLISEEGEQHWLDQKANGSLWGVGRKALLRKLKPGKKAGNLTR
ncbi:MAG: hypothetical protein ABSF48_29040 [Thermodesulfobacteriota bacterium]|jgi:hypothetical protein